MSTNNQHADPEDMFADTRMSFGDHLEELRVHLWRAVGGFLVALIFSFFIGNWVMGIIAHPVEEALGNFYDNRVKKVLAEVDASQKNELPPTEFVKLVLVKEQLRDALQPGREGDADNFPRPTIAREKDANGKEVPVIKGPDGQKLTPLELWVSHADPLREQAYLAAAQRMVGRRPALSTLSIQEAVVVYFKVCLVCGIVLGSPWIFWQLWSFIAAGLYPHEKKLVHVYLPISLGLFLGGVVICEVFVMPKAVEALLWFNEWLDLEPDLRLNEWLGFAIWMPVLFGASFQTPLVMLFLERVGILSVDIYRKYRKICYFLMAVFAGVITPSVDPISMLLMWVPMCLLFELGIWLCRLRPRQADVDIDVPETGEQIEV